MANHKEDPTSKTCDCRLHGIEYPEVNKDLLDKPPNNTGYEKSKKPISERETLLVPSKIKLDLKAFQPYNPLAKEIYIDNNGKVFDTDMKEIGVIRGSNITPEGITINIILDKSNN